MMRRAAYGAWKRRSFWSLPFASMTFARASDALYQTGAHTDGSSAYIATAGTDVLVLEDLGDGAGALARFEKSATNACLRNREIDDAAWSTYGSVTVTAGLGGPTGSDAERVQLNDLASIRYQILTPGAGWRAFSAYVRATSGTPDHYLYLYDGSVSHTAEGALSSTYRRLASAANCGSGAGNIGVADSRSGGAVGSALRDVRVSLVQLEDGRYPTSPIVTAGASATRAADSLTLASGSVPPELLTDRARFSQVRLEWDTADLASGDERWLLCFESGVADGIRIRHDGADVVLEAMYNSGTMASMNLGAGAKNALRGPIGWDPAAGLLYVNGTPSAAGTPWAWASGNDLRVGAAEGGGYELDGALGALGGW